MITDHQQNDQHCAGNGSDDEKKREPEVKGEGADLSPKNTENMNPVDEGVQRVNEQRDSVEGMPEGEKCIKVNVGGL